MPCKKNGSLLIVDLVHKIRTSVAVIVACSSVVVLRLTEYQKKKDGFVRLVGICRRTYKVDVRSDQKTEGLGFDKGSQWSSGWDRILLAHTI
jgi:hypothetical protein